jgi:hypothetical protein
LAPLAVTDAGFDDDQMRGTPVSGMPRMSLTVAFKIVELPLLTRNEVPKLVSEESAMDWTGQVKTGMAWLLKPLAEAKI